MCLSDWKVSCSELKRRYDLIHSLVETVKGYASHQKEVFDHLADARTKYFPAQNIKGKIEASGDLERAPSLLLVLQENYSQPKADESFLKMMDSQEGTENHIAVEALQRRRARFEYLYPHSFRPLLCRPGWRQQGWILPTAAGRRSRSEGKILIS